MPPCGYPHSWHVEHFKPQIIGTDLMGVCYPHTPASVKAESQVKNMFDDIGVEIFELPPELRMMLMCSKTLKWKGRFLLSLFLLGNGVGDPKNLDGKSTFMHIMAPRCKDLSALSQCEDLWKKVYTAEGRAKLSDKWYYFDVRQWVQVHLRTGIPRDRPGLAGLADKLEAFCAGPPYPNLMQVYKYCESIGLPPGSVFLSADAICVKHHLAKNLSGSLVDTFAEFCAQSPTPTVWQAMKYAEHIGLPITWVHNTPSPPPLLADKATETTNPELEHIVDLAIEKEPGFPKRALLKVKDWYEVSDAKQ